MLRLPLRVLLPLLIPAFLAACHAMPRTAAVEGSRSASARAHMQAPESPALAFVASARPGERAKVTDAAFGGTVTVQLEAAYHSASDRDCRRFAVTYPSPPRRETRYACFAGGRLQLVTIH